MYKKIINLIKSALDEIGAKSKQNIQIIFFGSYLKGNYTSSSDVDVVVIVDERNKSISDIIMNVFTDISIDNNLYFSPIILSNKDFKDKLKKKDPFIVNLVKEGASYGRELQSQWKKRIIRGFF